MKKEIVKDYTLIALGTLVMALGLNLFLIDNKITAGGASGVGTILYVRFGVPVSLVVLIINAILFAVGFRTLSRKTLLRSLYGMFALTAFLELTVWVPLLTTDPMLASLFGGVLVGVGVGLTVRQGASTGGTDFGALQMHKWIPHISVPRFILIIDAVIIAAAGILFSDYTVMLYSAISLFVSSVVADTIVEGGDAAKSAYIISAKSEEIAHELMQKLERGVTGIYGKGFYGNTDTTMLLCVVKRSELPRLRQIVIRRDPKAFMILTEVRQVLGEGFDKENL
ncbi:MAG: YitT family protein [Ruminococcaceae bacterium]|nr:YitT family protein [Oscillospiraceae bacterium]